MNMVPDYPLICDHLMDIYKTPRQRKNGHRFCHEPAVFEGFCESHIPYLKRRKREYDAYPLEKRQEFLDTWKGRTIGEAREIAGISLDLACDIINGAINTATYYTGRAT